MLVFRDASDAGCIFSDLIVIFASLIKIECRECHHAFAIVLRRRDRLRVLGICVVRQCERERLVCRGNAAQRLPSLNHSLCRRCLIGIGEIHQAVFHFIAVGVSHCLFRHQLAGLVVRHRHRHMVDCRIVGDAFLGLSFLLHRVGVGTSLREGQRLERECTGTFNRGGLELLVLVIVQFHREDRFLRRIRISLQILHASQHNRCRFRTIRIGEGCFHIAFRDDHTLLSGRCCRITGCRGFGHLILRSEQQIFRCLRLTMLQRECRNAVLEDHLTICAADGLVIQCHCEGELLRLITADNRLADYEASGFLFISVSQLGNSVFVLRDRRRPPISIHGQNVVRHVRRSYRLPRRLSNGVVTDRKVFDIPNFPSRTAAFRTWLILEVAVLLLSNLLTVRAGNREQCVIRCRPAHCRLYDLQRALIRCLLFLLIRNLDGRAVQIEVFGLIYLPVFTDREVMLCLIQLITFRSLDLDQVILPAGLQPPDGAFRRLDDHGSVLAGGKLFTSALPRGILGLIGLVQLEGAAGKLFRQIAFLMLKDCHRIVHRRSTCGCRFGRRVLRRGCIPWKLRRILQLLRTNSSGYSRAVHNLHRRLVRNREGKHLSAIVFPGNLIGRSFGRRDGHRLRIQHLIGRHRILYYQRRAVSHLGAGRVGVDLIPCDRLGAVRRVQLRLIRQQLLRKAWILIGGIRLCGTVVPAGGIRK